MLLVAVNAPEVLNDRSPLNVDNFQIEAALELIDVTEIAATALAARLSVFGVGVVPHLGERPTIRRGDDPRFIWVDGMVSEDFRGAH